MNIVQSGNVFRIYDDGIATHDFLPTGVYDINFHPMMGFSLSKHPAFVIKEEKIYGDSLKKIDKILRGFEVSVRNFGVILSGPKGVGKSLFARVLSERANEMNLPVIIVSSYVPGLASFIGSIEQEVLVLFDEFEKTFAEKEDCAPQEELLSLFDGIDCGKKLFIITCNDVDALNDYYLNRPGRFHYHFRMDVPSPEEIRDYLTDKLKPEYYGCIEKVVNFSCLGRMTYDCLRAIAFELNSGSSFAETLEDLNITRAEDMHCTIEVTRTNGRTYSNTCWMDFSGSGNTSLWVYDYAGGNGGRDSVRITFKNSNIYATKGHLTIDKDKVLVQGDNPDEDDSQKLMALNDVESVAIRAYTPGSWKYSEKMLAGTDSEKSESPTEYARNQVPAMRAQPTF